MRAPAEAHARFTGRRGHGRELTIGVSVQASTSPLANLGYRKNSKNVKIAMLELPLRAERVHSRR
jgi:hypothetical protein